MKITEEEKDALLNTVREIQKTEIRVYLDKLKEKAPVSKWKFANVIAAMHAEGRIHVGGARGVRWCVPDEPDKERQILAWLAGGTGWPTGMSELCTITGLGDKDIVDICVRLHIHGGIVITQVNVVGRAPYEEALRNDEVAETEVDREGDEQTE